MNRTEVLHAIKAAKLGHLSARLVKVMQPGIGLTTAPLSPSRERVIGGTRIGGLPDLPAGSRWPRIKGRLLIFAAQFNLAELSRFPAAKALPKTGLLSFFHDERVGAKVLYTRSTASLQRIPAPDGTCNEAFAAVLRTEWTLPELEEIDGDEFPTIPAIVPIISDRRDWARYWPMRRKVRGPYM
jgi:hypothetical protein